MKFKVIIDKGSKEDPNPYPYKIVKFEELSSDKDEKVNVAMTEEMVNLEQLTNRIAGLQAQLDELLEIKSDIMKNDLTNGESHDIIIEGKEK